MRKIYIQTPQAQDTQFLRGKPSQCEKEKPRDCSPLKQFHYQ
jgi:hypothetical protein